MTLHIIMYQLVKKSAYIIYLLEVMQLSIPTVVVLIDNRC